MDVNHPSAGELPGEPGPIPFSIRLPHQVLEGAIAISHDGGDPDVVTLDVHLSGERLASAALTEESALDLALRLIGTIMNRRRAARVTRTIPGGYSEQQGRRIVELVPPRSD